MRPASDECVVLFRDYSWEDAVLNGLDECSVGNEGRAMKPQRAFNSARLSDVHAAVSAHLKIWTRICRSDPDLKTKRKQPRRIPTLAELPDHSGQDPPTSPPNSALPPSFTSASPPFHHPPRPPVAPGDLHGPPRVRRPPPDLLPPANPRRPPQAVLLLAPALPRRLRGAHPTPHPPHHCRKCSQYTTISAECAWVAWGGRGGGLVSRMEGGRGSRLSTVKFPASQRSGQGRSRSIASRAPCRRLPVPFGSAVPSLRLEAAPPRSSPGG